MNLQEFSALKIGDKIEAMNGSVGEIISINAQGVHLCWPPSATSFFYSVQSTAWMHWTKIEGTPNAD